MLGVRMLGASRVGLEQFPDPRPADGEALVRVRCSGLCGSELHGYRGPGHPFNFGHEAMGVVVETRGTKRLKVGDRVGVHAIWGCGACAECKAGRYTYCADRKLTAPTHAEYVAAPEHVLIALPDDVPDEVGVLLSGDGLGVPYHASRRLPGVAGDTVCVVGLGPIGLGNVLLQSFLGLHVVALDVNEYRLGLAKEMGAEHVVSVAGGADAAIAAVREITRGAMARTAIECVGQPETLKMALALVGAAGTVMAIGEQGQVQLNVSDDLIRRDITLMGSWFFHYSEFPEMLALYRQGLELQRLFTHRFSIGQAGAAFEAFASGTTGKVALLP